MDDLGKGQSVPGRQSDTALPGVNRLTKAPIDLPAFVRQRLLNLANLSKQDFGASPDQVRLGTSALSSLSVSKHRDALVLKGALLFQQWTSEPYRPT